MDLPKVPAMGQRLLVDALVTYAAACKRPELTPTCPFFVKSDEGPTCGEECHALIDSFGVAQTSILEATFGGLTMTGRAFPMRMAGGYSDYDAGRTFITERTHPPHSQSTASILLGLRSALTRPAIGSDGNRSINAVALTSELDRRGANTDGILRGALLPHVAKSIALHSVIPSLSDANELSEELKVSFSAEGSESSRNGWAAVLNSYIEHRGGIDRAAESSTHSLRMHRRALQTRVPTFNDPTKDRARIERIADSKFFQIAISDEYLLSLEEWLDMMLNQNRINLFQFVPPSPSVFNALIPRRVITRDEHGLWIWDRLTLTQVAEWNTSSLLLEWRNQRGEPEIACSPQILAERTVDHNQVSDLALERVSHGTGRKQPSNSLAAGKFVQTAVDYLNKGQWAPAARIFEGLVDLLPNDSEALNNWGFCLLPLDANSALPILQRARFYSENDTFVNSINLVLAFHLTGRDENARDLARILLNQDLEQDHPAVLWRHQPGERDCSVLQRDVHDLRPYLQEIDEHIKFEACAKHVDSA